MSLVNISKRVGGSAQVTVFHIMDRVNLGNYKELEQVANDEYERGTRNLVIDLTHADSLTSIGIRALIAISKMMAKDDGKHLKIAGAIQSISETLNIAGVTQFVDLYDTVDEAVAAFA